MALFGATYGAVPRAAASAPGRVNLLGEHTHYNGGPVLTIATRERLCVAVGPGEDGVLELVSASEGPRERVCLYDARPEGSLAYVAGVLHELAPLGAAGPRAGARVAVASDLPVGAGLASSAAFAVATARALGTMAGARLTPRQLSGVGFRAERDHAAVACGVMDHAAVALARPGHALLVECASADARQVPLAAPLLLVATGARLDQAAALLDRRRAECAAAVERLRLELPELFWLASWPAGWIARLKKALPEPLRSRALHVVGEASRTRFGAELLRRGRLARFGALLYESHESSRRLFDWSTPEADLVVAAAHRAGAFGARLTGLGANGLVLVLLGKRDGGRGKRAAKVTAASRRAFVKTCGREPAIEVVRPAGGMRREAVR